MGSGPAVIICGHRNMAVMHCHVVHYLLGVGGGGGDLNQQRGYAVLPFRCLRMPITLSPPSVDPPAKRPFTRPTPFLGPSSAKTHFKKTSF